MASASQKPHTTKRKQLHRHVQRHYYAYMPNKKHHRIAIWVVFLLISTIIAAQLLYPLDRSMPFARVAGESATWKSHDELAAVIDQKFRSSKIRLVTAEGANVETSLSSAGAEPATEAMIGELMNYPFWQRFIPLSVLWQRPSIEVSQHSFSSSVLKTYTEVQATKLSTKPTNARLTIQDGRLRAESERRGSSVSRDTVSTSVVDAQVQLGETTEIIIPSTPIEPVRSAADFASVKQLAEAALARNVTITAKGTSFTPDQKTLASWLVITDSEIDTPTITVDSKAFNRYLDTINKKVAISAGQTDIKLVDGREVARSVGKTGDTINRAPLLEGIEAWLLEGIGQRDFTAEFVDVKPSTIYNSRYTSSQAGLQAYLNDVSKRMDVHIAVQQIGGTRWKASVRASESIPSASTFKLFVAKWLFKEMDNGKIKWSDRILDTDVSTCFDRMTIASTNPCAYEWLDQAGRSQMNSYIYSLGFSRGTTFTAPDATHTTANDLQKMMIGIENNSLISGAHKDRLLHSLSVHPYRYGIPTGSKGQVWDKVGFLWDYVHDTAIVKTDQGSYVMTIMTKGQSYATIATITREIEKIMYGQ